MFLLRWLVITPATVLFALDQKVWSVTNKLSQWLQKAFAVSKWWLALITLTAGAFLQVEPSKGWSWLFPICYGHMIWQIYRKAKKHSNHEGDVIDIESHALVKTSRWMRIPLLVSYLIVLPFLIEHFVSDPYLGHLLEHYDFTLGFPLLILGMYFIDATYIPPGGRRLLDFTQQLAQAGNSG